MSSQGAVDSPQTVPRAFLKGQNAARTDPEELPSGCEELRATATATAAAAVAAKATATQQQQLFHEVPKPARQEIQNQGSKEIAKRIRNEQQTVKKQQKQEAAKTL